MRANGPLDVRVRPIGDSVGVGRLLRQARIDLPDDRSPREERIDVPIDENYGDPWQHVRPSEFKKETQTTG